MTSRLKELTSQHNYLTSRHQDLTGRHGYLTGGGISMPPYICFTELIANNLISGLRFEFTNKIHIFFTFLTSSVMVLQKNNLTSKTFADLVLFFPLFLQNTHWTIKSKDDDIHNQLDNIN